jgi:hypothetical protein
MSAEPAAEEVAGTTAAEAAEDTAAAAAMAAAKLDAGVLDCFLANADEIRPWLWVGGEDAAADAALLRLHGVTHVLVQARAQELVKFLASDGLVGASSGAQGPQIFE